MFKFKVVEKKMEILLSMLSKKLQKELFEFGETDGSVLFNLDKTRPS